MSSSYYWGLHGQKVAEAAKYAGHKAELEGIRGEVTKTYSDVSSFNTKLKACADDLEDGVLLLASVPAKASRIRSREEKASTSDSSLSSAYGSITAEINALQLKIEECNAQAEQYASQARAAEEEERRREEERRAAEAAAQSSGK